MIENDKPNIQQINSSRSKSSLSEQQQLQQLQLGDVSFQSVSKTKKHRYIYLYAGLLIVLLSIFFYQFYQQDRLMLRSSFIEERNKLLSKDIQTIKNTSKILNGQTQMIRKEIALVQQQAKDFSKAAQKIVKYKIQIALKQNQNKTKADAQNIIEKTLKDEIEKKLKSESFQAKDMKDKIQRLQQQRKKHHTLYSPDQLKEKEKYLKQLQSFVNKRQNPQPKLFYSLIFKQKIEVNVQKATEESLPVCAIVPKYLPYPHYILEHSLTSIFMQDYNNYKAIIFSHPQESTNLFIGKYLEVNHIPSNRYAIINSNGTALQNIYNAIHNYCQNESIVFIIQGGHSLIKKDVFQYFNFKHSTSVNAIIISNHYKINATKNILQFGGTGFPSEDQIKNRDFSGKVFYQGLTFRSNIFKQIKIEDLKNDKGQFFEAYVFPIMVPLLQLSCKGIRKIQGLHLIEFVNDNYWSRVEKEKEVFKLLKNKKNYQCSGWVKQAKQRLIHNHPYLQYVSQVRKQKGGLMNVNGDVKGIDQLFINKEGKSIKEVLYPTKQEKRFREERHTSRVKFVDRKATQFPGIQLIKHNLKLNNSLDQVERQQEMAEYLRLNTKYRFDEFKQQLPMCIIACSYNNKPNMRVEYNLNSFFRQNYSNYFVAVINDNSNDGTDLLYRKYFDFHNISKDKYVYIENHQHKTALENVYNAAHNLCSNDSIFIVVDGDDELIGKNVLKLFNVNYQRLKGGHIYTNYFKFDVGQISVGFASDYLLQEKQKMIFRQLGIKFSHTRSYNTSLFKTIDSVHFKNGNGEFLKSAADTAISIPIMERACGRVYGLPQINYLYNAFTGMNDGAVNYWLQFNTKNEIMAKKKLDCDPYFQNVTLFPAIFF